MNHSLMGGSILLTDNDNYSAVPIVDVVEVDESLKCKLYEIFKKPNDFNWAWQFYCENTGDWIQFDCPDCLQLEFNFQAFKISGKDSFKIFDTVKGKVNFETLKIEDILTKQILEVRRTPNNARKRPNAYRRHDPLDELESRISSFGFHSQEQLEFLSINYRKQRAAKICTSKRRLIIIMFQKEIPYFPTLREIRDQLIQAQLHELKQRSQHWDNKTKFYLLKNTYKFNWEVLFELNNLGQHLDEPLTVKILSDPNHAITQRILYIYSMECFIYEDMNKACRDQDKSKIKFYGAFAAALSYIIYSANKHRTDKKVTKQSHLFRGVKMQLEEV